MVNIIKDFYNKNPFPDFDINKYSNQDDLKNKVSWFFELLDFYIPLDKQILDVGCGTGQYSNFLALKGRRVLGVDFSAESLVKANALKDKLNLLTVEFLNMDLLDLKAIKEKFDYVFCCGVLHHTNDHYLGFKNLVDRTNDSGYIVLGLYNRFGRILHGLKRFILNFFLKSNLKLRNYFIQKQLGCVENDELRIDSWFKDQYANPFEKTHTIGEVLLWFKKNNIEYINSFPAIELFRRYSGKKFVRFQPNPFIRQDFKPWRYSKLSRFLKQLVWIVSLNWMGGYFLIIGQKQK